MCLRTICHIMPSRPKCITINNYEIYSRCTLTFLVTCFYVNHSLTMRTSPPSTLLLRKHEEVQPVEYFEVSIVVKSWSPYSCKGRRTCLRRCFKEDLKALIISVANISCERSILVTMWRPSHSWTA